VEVLLQQITRVDMEAVEAVKEPQDLHHHKVAITMKVSKQRRISTRSIQAMNKARSGQRTFSKITGKISGMVLGRNNIKVRRAITKTSIGQRPTENTKNIKEGVAGQQAVPRTILSGQMAEGLHIAVISIPRVKILNKRGLTIKQAKKRLRKMNSIDSITKSIISNRVNNTKVQMRRPTLAMIKTATLIDLRRIGSDRNQNRKLTQSMKRKKTPCFISLTVDTTSTT